MAEEASHQLARKVVAKVCQPLGWQGMQNGACDVLADLLKRYVITLGRTTAAYVSNGKLHTPYPTSLLHKTVQKNDISCNNNSL